MTKMQNRYNKLRQKMAEMGLDPRTSTIALTNATLRYGLEIAKSGLEDACKANPVIATGVNCYDGKIVNKNVALALDYECADLSAMI